jgi:hypothetical protein
MRQTNFLLPYFTQSVRLNPDVLLIKGRVLKIDIILPLSVQNYYQTIYSFTQLVGNTNVAHKLPGFK